MNVKELIFHCSDSKWGNASIVTKWHIERGWTTCGYHYIILSGWLYPGFFDEKFDGAIETGRPRIMEGAHTKRHNKETLGICLIGKPGLYTNKQTRAAKELILYLQDIYGNLKISQHSDYDDKKHYCAKLNLDEIRV